ncbi:alpha-glucosidase [Nostoc sp. LPT]|uniref:alpha-glucosidase n=1 Tax=Nostoc sp. LPT TaxID=2815387 RepID=UPI001DB0E2BD|nr:alpha-glucosidase [Nostoc sp. LPT]
MLSEPRQNSDGSQTLPNTGSRTHTVGKFLLDVKRNSIRVRHADDAARSLWETTPKYPFLQAAAADATFREYGNPSGSFEVTDKVSFLNTFKSIDSTRSVDPSTLIIHGILSGSRFEVTFRLTFQALFDNQLQFTVGLEGENASQFNRIFLRYASNPNEAFFGFGHQLTYFNQKGKVIPILVQEHGIGRGLPGITQLVDLKYDGAGGNPYITEAPAPHYITSQLRSLFLENKEYSIFDMRDANFVEVKLFSKAMTGRILFGRTPLNLIEEYTTYAGRMRPLPDWIHEGVMVAAQGGSLKVNDRLEKLIDAKVPFCGLWIQDWAGINQTDAGKQVVWNWQLSLKQYPDWDKLLKKLAKYNARVFIYMNPFLLQEPCSPDNASCRNLYEEANQKGYLIRQNGTAYVYKNSSIKAGMVDLSNEEARNWLKNLIKEEMIGKAQASGWMADFGEALPFNAQLSGNADPAVWHNHYPEAWARLHREAIEETGRGKDFVFWNRSGFTQSPAVSTAFWLGDQLQTWDEYDGIKTAVVGLLSGGMSGFSLLHSDTGGFDAAAFDKIPVIARSKELLMRWIELNAFTVIFRTHDGLVPEISAQIDTDKETLSHLARFGQVYKSLAAYRKTLVDQAAKVGYPVVRHLVLHYPNDPNVYDLRYQFMLGSDFLVAPVLDKGVETVQLYLPAGEWIHLWTGAKFDSEKGKWIKVSAPLGKPGVFFRDKAVFGEHLVTELKALHVL